MTAGGRYSKFLPKRLAARYEEALKDPDLIACRDEIALLDTRLSELLQRIDTAETGKAWSEANTLFQEMVGGPPAKAKNAIRALGEILERGLKDSATWAEIVFLTEQRRKCSETEQKRMAQMEQFVTTKEANLLVGALLHLVTENVSDPGACQRIAAGLIKLTSAEPGGRFNAGVKPN